MQKAYMIKKCQKDTKRSIKLIKMITGYTELILV